MAFDNVTLFEINFEEFPFGSESSDEADAESVAVAEAPVADEASEASGGRAQRVVGLLFGAVVLAAVARQVAKRRGGDADEFDTEEIEPGVERVEA